MTEHKQPLLRVTLRGYAWGIFAISIWAAWMVSTRFDLSQQDLTVYDITALRFGSAALVLIPVLIKNGFLPRSVGLRGMIIMASGAGAPYCLVASAGLLYAPASQAGALIPGVMPLFTAILSMIFLGEHLSRDRILGLVFIPAGVLLIVGLHSIATDEDQLLGQLLFLIASFMWASYTVALRKSGVHPLHGVAIVSFWSAVVFIPVFYFADLPSGLGKADISTITYQIIFQGLLTSVISLVAFNRAVTILGASKGALLGALVPAEAAILSVIFLREIPSTFESAGIGMITFGVLLGSGALSFRFQRKGQFV